MMSLVITANAAALEQNAEDIYYSVHNENGEIVEEGIVPKTSIARYHWSPTLSLSNGWFIRFCLPGPSAFWVTSGTSMRLSYELNRTATIEYQFMKSSQNSVTNANVWRSGIIRDSRGAGITKISDSTAYYYTIIKNASSDPIILTSVDFDF